MRRRLAKGAKRFSGASHLQTISLVPTLWSSTVVVVHVMPGLAFTRVNVGRSECQPSGSVLVARSVCVRIDHGSMLPYEGLLRILS